MFVLIIYLYILSLYQGNKLDEEYYCKGYIVLKKQINMTSIIDEEYYYITPHLF